MTRAPATAKLNLALVVGSARDGRHELTTVYQRLDLADRVTVVPGPSLQVTGFPKDTLVRNALEGLAAAAGVPPRWTARLTKRIPVAAGLGGGSSDAATALGLANETLDEPLPSDELHALAAKLGADVPFFLTQGPQLGEGDGTELTPLDLPQDYWVVLVLPRGATKQSSGAVYAEFDDREGPKGYRTRRAALKRSLKEAKRARGSFERVCQRHEFLGRERLGPRRGLAPDPRQCRGRLLARGEPGQLERVRQRLSPVGEGSLDEPLDGRVLRGKPGPPERDERRVDVRPRAEDAA